jgi:hypothetical protein
VYRYQLTNSMTCLERLASLVSREMNPRLTFLVDLEAYPDYLEIVGGEDKMMDLGTIQGKIDNEEYRSIDEFQVSHSRWIR